MEGDFINEDFNELIKFQEELIEQEKTELEELKEPLNKEYLWALREAYSIFINIVIVFMKNPQGLAKQLNDNYIKIKDLIIDLIIKKLNIYNNSKILRINNYDVPFNNLFSAEKETINNKGFFIWSTIRPNMLATYGEIDNLCQKVEVTEKNLNKEYEIIFQDINNTLDKIRSTSIKRVAKEETEEIILKNLRIKIKDNLIFYKTKKIHLSPTEKSLIYFLYYKYIENKNRCFSFSDLSEYMKKKNGTIENAKVTINNKIKKIISKDIETRAPDLIIYEKKRKGYRLNPALINV